MSYKSLADVKRRIKLGTKLKRIYKNQDPIIGVVTRVQTNAIAITYGEGKTALESWLYWPSASEVIFEDEKFIILDDRGERRLSYEEV